MKLSLIVLLLALLASACNWQVNPTHHYNLDIETGFTANQYGMVIDAADRWTAATDGFITFGLIGYRGDPTTITVTGMSVADLDAKYGDGYAGMCQWTGGENSDLYLSNNVDDIKFEHIAEHELGHSLGLDHTGPGTVMCKSIGCSSQDITCADVEQFCRIWGCNAWGMRICQAK